MDIIVTAEDFSAQEQYQLVRDAAPHAGAVVMFVGLVRDFYGDQAEGSDYDQAEGSSGHTDKGSAIDHLELEHYPGMTEALCQEIIDRARDTFCLDAVRVVHRVGKITASEQIVLVVVASKHRGDAFNGAQFIMDYLKTRATFWKKEVGTNGAQWLGLKQADQEAALRWTESNAEGY